MVKRQFDLVLKVKNHIIRPDQINTWAHPIEEKEIADFLDEWYNEHDYITVKTSGTTGPPKNIRLSKSAMLESAKRTCAFFNLNSHSTFVLCLSPKYIAGKMMIVRAMVAGANLMPVFDLNKPDGIQGSIDFIAMVPMQLSQLIDKHFNFDLFKIILLGGSALPNHLEAKIATINSRVYQSYGMTETASHVALRCLNGEARSEYYTALPGINFETNSTQQLVIRAPYISDSPLITNDIVDLIDENHFRWIGRKDNVINSGGIKFFPEHIESKLKHHLDTDFYIHWEEDRVLGQKIVLILQSDSQISKHQLTEIFDKYLTRYEKPRKIIYKEHIKYTPTGKIIRQ